MQVFRRFEAGSDVKAAINHKVLERLRQLRWLDRPLATSKAMLGRSRAEMLDLDSCLPFLTLRSRLQKCENRQN